MRCRVSSYDAVKYKNNNNNNINIVNKNRSSSFVIASILQNSGEYYYRDDDYITDKENNNSITYNAIELRKLLNNNTFDPEDDYNDLPIDEAETTTSSTSTTQLIDDVDNDVDICLNSNDIIIRKSTIIRIGTIITALISIGIMLNTINIKQIVNNFLLWVQDHPIQGLVCTVIVMCISVITMIPIGTPLILGCGYIYKVTYGWTIGICIACIISIIGNQLLGSICCFILGRYIMSERVQIWRTQYPILDAINIAFSNNNNNKNSSSNSSSNSLTIMAMMYLTPILPLGPISYMCGATTTMSLTHFCLPKIAAIPLILIYVFIGASTADTFGSHSDNNTNNNSSSSLHTSNNPIWIISVIIISIISISSITIHVKRELNKILLEKQQHNNNNNTLDDNIMMRQYDDDDEEQQKQLLIQSLEIHNNNNLDNDVNNNDNVVPRLVVPITPSQQQQQQLPQQQQSCRHRTISHDYYFSGGGGVEQTIIQQK